MELSRLKGEPCTGGAAVVYKCFDQIQRPLLYRIMKEAGMPAKGDRGTSPFPREPKSAQRDSRRDRRSLYKANEHSPRRSVLDDVDIVVDAGVDHADAFSIGAAQAVS